MTTKRGDAQIESQARTRAAADPSAAPVADPGSASRSLASDIRRYGEDLEQRYVAARDAWTKAMRAANSGRPAHMASLAIAQEAYEAVAAERERWLASGRVAIPVEPEPKEHTLHVAIAQQLEWRRVLDREKPGGLFSRIRRRLGGH
jgi:hypothetical protein